MENVLIADDNYQIRESIGFFISELHPDIKIHEASNGKEALEILESKPIDFAILDYNMPIYRGDQVIEKARRKEIQAPMIIFSMETQAEIIKYVIQQAGCSGYLLKSDSLDELCQACESVALGKGYLSKSTLSSYLSQLSEFREMNIPTSKVYEDIRNEELDDLITAKEELKVLKEGKDSIENEAFTALNNKLI